MQTSLLSISRTHLYYQPAAPSAREVAIKHCIDELFTECPFYGSRKLHALLLPTFGPLARNTVRRYMQEMGLAAIYPGPKLSQRHPEHRVYPYLLRNVIAAHPNHIWGVDITYVRVRGSWLYLVAILDWFSRYVISWAVDDSLEIAFVLDAMDRALNLATPLIWNSDQGSHFTSPRCIERLQAKGVQISMDGRCRAFDNIFTERFWRSLKYEEVSLHDYGNPREARAGITRYMGLYNHKRPHEALGYQTPVTWYLGRPA
jgi:putative transposase